MKNSLADLVDAACAAAENAQRLYDDLPLQGDDVLLMQWQKLSRLCAEAIGLINEAKQKAGSPDGLSAEQRDKLDSAFGICSPLARAARGGAIAREHSLSLAVQPDRRHSCM